MTIFLCGKYPLVKLLQVEKIVKQVMNLFSGSYKRQNILTNREYKL